MFTAKVENAQGEVLVLTGDEPRWQVYRITGLNPPKGQINTTEIAGMDGAWFNSSKLDVRNIVIYIKINGDAQENRLTLYNYFRTKQKLTFFFSHSRRDVYIEGYCESVQVSPFDRSQVMQISILCPFPYFRSMDGKTLQFSPVQALFEFPFSIDEDDPIPFSELSADGSAIVVNDSDEDVGMTITAEIVHADVKGFKLVNADTGATIELDYNFANGDVIQIKTETGNKRISLLRNGATTNIFSAMVFGSDFIQLRPGANHITYYAKHSGSWEQNDESLCKVSFAFNMIYRGV